MQIVPVEQMPAVARQSDHCCKNRIDAKQHGRRRLPTEVMRRELGEQGQSDIGW